MKTLALAKKDDSVSNSKNNWSKVAKKNCQTINTDKNMPFNCRMYIDNNGVYIVQTTWTANAFTDNFVNVFTSDGNLNLGGIIRDGAKNISKVKYLEDNVFNPFCAYYKQHGMGTKAMIISGNESWWCKSP